MQWTILQYTDQECTEPTNQNGYVSLEPQPILVYMQNMGVNPLPILRKGVPFIFYSGRFYYKLINEPTLINIEEIRRFLAEKKQHFENNFPLLLLYLLRRNHLLIILETLPSHVYNALEKAGIDNLTDIDIVNQIFEHIPAINGDKLSAVMGIILNSDIIKNRIMEKIFDERNGF